MANNTLFTNKQLILILAIILLIFKPEWLFTIIALIFLLLVIASSGLKE